MVLNGDDFLTQLLETFRDEAQEHLSAIASGLLILEQPSTPREEYDKTIEQVFRETHSLKGAARAVGLHEIENLCQYQESVFSVVRKGGLTLTPESFDLFHTVVHTLELLLADEKGVKTSDIITRLRNLTSFTEKESEKPHENSQITPPIDNSKRELIEKTVGPDSVSHSSEISSDISKKPDELEKKSLPDTPVPEPENSSCVETGKDTSKSSIKESKLPSPPHIREEAARLSEEKQVSHSARGGSMIKISSERLENLFARADDLMGARLAAGQRALTLREISQNFLHWRWAWSQISTDVEHLRSEREKYGNGSSSLNQGEIERITEFLLYNRTFLRILEGDIATLSRVATRDQYLLDTATTELIDEIKQVILVPASSILEGFPRAAHNLARESGKDVDVTISGTEIEIDRRILETIRDPILHIIRNSIDHGIETREERISKGKPERAQITISVRHGTGHQAEIRISDDGTGIDTQKVSAAAIAKGLISAEEVSRMDSNLIFRLIFKSGLSTKTTVTTVSGRGLGLAIVIEKVEQIGGNVHVESSCEGTTFILTLPLSLATFRGLKVLTNGNPFFLPLRSIERVMQVSKEDIKTIESRTIIEIDDEPVAVINLGTVLGFSEDTGKAAETRQLVIASASGVRFGLFVDQISGAQEIVVKDLGRQLRRVRHISGASILGDGVVIPVINCEDLAATISGMEHMPSIIPVHTESSQQKSILVTEDSITSRMLLKNILEGAGYLVETAVDGVDALMKLKLKPVDVVVSDVDMPRMNGFVLTEKIRADPVYADIPVILVTSLDSREDREHGITVGASAYIVKSSFDQSNLLEVISRHIQ